MKTLIDPERALSEGLARIRQEFQLPPAFPPAVLAAAEEASQRAPTEHVDRTDRPFVTLDPASSTDLDQAFAIDATGADLLLHYAIADVAWFVDDGGPIDAEAWTRGTSQYLPDGKTPLYPSAIGEKAASLLPDGPRPAVIFTVRIAPDGTPTIDGVERAVIRSRAKLAYDRVTPAELPDGFAELARRVAAAEDRRGAARVDPPEQEVVAGEDGHFQLRFRPRVPAEDQNAALSLATNLAVAQLMIAHRTGLFRVMAPPTSRAIERLRHTAEALGLTWPADQTLEQFDRTLDAANPHHAAFMLAERRAGTGAGYAPYDEAAPPWHAAVAAPYAHATAPLRRLADRYVVQGALALANGEPVPEAALAAFPKLPPVMAKADAIGGRIERAVIDLAEAAILASRVGETFAAVVTDTDERGARIQLRDQAVVARLSMRDLEPGQPLTVRLLAADPVTRTLTFDCEA